MYQKIIILIILTFPIKGICQHKVANSQTTKSSLIYLKDSVLLQHIRQFVKDRDSTATEEFKGKGYLRLHISSSNFRQKEVSVSYHFDLNFESTDFIKKSVKPLMYSYIDGRPIIITFSAINKFVEQLNVELPQKLVKDINAYLDPKNLYKYDDYFWAHGGRTLYYFRDKKEAPYLDMHPY